MDWLCLSEYLKTFIRKGYLIISLSEHLKDSKLRYSSGNTLKGVHSTLDRPSRCLQFSGRSAQLTFFVLICLQGCQKQFATLNSLLIHHSVMPELLPCPLLMNRFNNPIYRNTEEDSGSSQNGEDNEDNYLDPERDYELINNLRKFIMNEVEHETVLEDAHYH